MATGGDAALAYASRLDEIGFPEFTTKLVSDTFDALIAANLRQQQGYIELIEAVSKSLKTYINDTKDDIGPSEIMQLLAAAVPPASPSATSEPTKVKPTAKLTEADATALNKALEVKGVDIDKDNKVATAGTVSQSGYEKILDAAAVRLAANKYDQLEQMTKLGMLRLVVDDGTIETRLNFHTYGSEYFNRNTSDYSRDSFQARANAKTGGLLSLWVNASASTSYTSVNVSTTNTRQTESSGADVNIFGGVKIHFHTDYLPLNKD